MRVVCRKIQRWPALAIFAMVWSCVSAVRADVVTVFPIADTYARQLAPDTAGGTEPSFVAGSLADFPGNREIRRAFMRFDLNGKVPAGASINSATLTITVVREPLSDLAPFSLHRVLSDWSESDLTWNSRLNGVPWDSAAAEGPN